MATSKVESAAKTGSPAGTLNVPRGTSVSPATQSKGRATQRAVAATRPKAQRTVSGAFDVYAAGPPQEMLSERQFRRGELEQAEQSYYGMEPFKPEQFSQRRPMFDSQAVSKMMPNLLVMMSLGGRATRVNALGMMKAMTAGMKGFQEGNQDAYKQAMFDYQQNFQEFAAREKVRREQYDFLRDAAKDGLEVAIRRYDRANAAVGDWDTSAKNNIALASTLESNIRDAQKHGAEMTRIAAQTEAERELANYRRAQTLSELNPPSANAKSPLTADQKNKVFGAGVLLNAVNDAMKAMEQHPEDFSTAVNSAFVYSPRVTELAGVLSPTVRQSIPSQQRWRNALNIKVVQQAGLSQTVAEMNNQLAAAGTQTLEGRKAGMATIRVTLLRELKDTANLDPSIRPYLETKFGKSIEQELAEAEAARMQIDAEIRRQNTPSGVMRPAVSAPKSFRTEAEAEAAFRAGKIRKGDAIVVGGVTGTWE